MRKTIFLGIFSNSLFGAVENGFLMVSSGDNEAETGLLRAKKSVDGGENGDSGAAAGIGDRRTSEIPKVGPKLADLSSNIEEKGPEPLSPDKRDIACASWVKNDGSRQKNRERSDLRGESEVLCVKNDDLTESVEQTASEVTGSTIREDGYVENGLCVVLVLCGAMIEKLKYFSRYFDMLWKCSYGVIQGWIARNLGQIVKI